MKQLRILFLLSSILLYFFCPISSVNVFAEETAAPETPVKIYYFHQVICESCAPEEEFQEFLEEVIPSDRLHRPYTVLSYCIYTVEGRQVLNQLTQADNVDAESLSFPAVYIDGTWLEGESSFHTSLPDLLTPASDDLSFEAFEENSLNLLFFETEGCDSCKEAGKILDQLPSRVTIDGENISLHLVRKNMEEDGNANLLYSLFTSCQVPAEKQMVPILFLGEHYLAGAEEIKALTEEYIAAGYGIGASYNVSEDSSPFISTLSWTRILFTGLLNGLNPCALSMALLFLSLLLTLPRRQGVCGLAFLLGKYASFLLLGILFRLALSELFLPGLADIGRVMGIVLFLFSLVLALFNLLDFVSASKGSYGKIKLQLPKPIRKWDQRLMETLFQSRRPLLPLSIFLASFLISSTEALCTGQIYLASILSWLQEAPQGNIPYVTFLLYVAALCTPTAILLLLGLCGKSLVSLSRTSLKQVRWVKLANCLLFLFMAFLALRMLL